MDELNYDVFSWFKQISIKKNTVLHLEGSVCNKLFYIKKGAVKTYFTTDEGLMKTRYIGMETSLVSCLSSFISGTPSDESLMTIEESVLLYITREQFYELVKTDTNFNQLYITLLEAAYSVQHDILMQEKTQSAKQRYEYIMDKKPDLIQRLSNRQVASFLNISHETLSRVKSN